jgi:peptide subunit release factor 1 (eRF1)
MEPKKERIRPQGVEPAEWNRSGAREVLWKVQEKVLKEAKTVGEKKDADRFCRELEKEVRFYRGK